MIGRAARTRRHPTTEGHECSDRSAMTESVKQEPSGDDNFDCRLAHPELAASSRALSIICLTHHFA